MTAFQSGWQSFSLCQPISLCIRAVRRLYNCGRLFIGQSLGDIGLAAITPDYPVSALAGAVGAGIGRSGAIRFTILNAQGEAGKRQECFTGTAMLMLLARLWR